MEYQNYINGEWVPSHTGERYESIDPATGEVIGTVPRSDEQDVEAAVAAARQAFEWWRLTPAPAEARFSSRLAGCSGSTSRNWASF